MEGKKYGLNIVIASVTNLGASCLQLFSSTHYFLTKLVYLLTISIIISNKS
jgi:uncharacterized protein YoxC